MKYLIAEYNLLKKKIQNIISNISMPTPNPTLWGWQLVQGEFTPILTGLNAASDKHLNTIKFVCRTTFEKSSA